MFIFDTLQNIALSMTAAVMLITAPPSSPQETVLQAAPLECAVTRPNALAAIVDLPPAPQSSCDICAACLTVQCYEACMRNCQLKSL